MRIAYLNPWTNAAENQAYFSLASAGEALGIDLVSCRTPTDIEDCSPELVLSVASSVPKVIDLPSYLTVHEPTERFLNRTFYMNNLLSYDGYLTISDTLERFVKDVCFGTGRHEGVGFFYNTPQASTLQADLKEVAAGGDLRLVFVGTNWDRRAPALLRKLDARGILRIHGPESSWSHHRYRGYAGPLAFDGEAPQRAYAAAGVGLVLLSADHLREDVISNRIFEIASVGAVPVCPDTPWIRRWFGDTVLYFTPSSSPGDMAEEIVERYESVKADPGSAQHRAMEARAVFERHFSAERMLTNLVSYHEEVQQARRRRHARLPPEPRVSVVMRCGSRPVEDVEAAVDSIRNQTYGLFTVIFAKFEEMDLSPVVRRRSPRIERFVEVSIPRGTRAETLVGGLREIDTEYFAILDDDDFWFSEHIETLFGAAQLVDPDFDVAFAGTVCVAAEGTAIETSLVWHRNIYSFGFSREPSSIPEMTSAFASNCFVAKTSLLPPGLESLGSLETAEDSLLIALVSRKKRPVFSYKATALFRRGYAGESDFSSRASRDRDLLSLGLRSGMMLRPAWLSVSTEWQPGRAGEAIPARRARSLPRRLARRAVHIAAAMTRDLVGDVVVLARIGIAACTGRRHPSARKDLLVSPFRSLRRSA